MKGEGGRWGGGGIFRGYFKPLLFHNVCILDGSVTMNVWHYQHALPGNTIVTHTYTYTHTLYIHLPTMD